MKNIFAGMGVAMVTPFTGERTIDFSGLERLTKHLIDGGVDYLVVMGTTGESATLSAEEKRTVLDFVLEVNAGRVKIVYGIGGNNTAQLAQEVAQNLEGVDGILSVSPAYSKPSQEGIYQHFRVLAEASKLPILLYNVPGRTASNMTSSTTLRLANDFSNIIGIKEASGDLIQVQEIIQKAPEGFAVVSGDDALTLPMISVGAQGLISVIGNAFPNEYTEMVHKALEGNFLEAKKIHFELFEMIHYLFVDGNPAGVKECLQNLGLCENHLRLPLVPVTSNTKDKLYRLMAELRTVVV